MISSICLMVGDGGAGCDLVLRCLSCDMCEEQRVVVQNTAILFFSFYFLSSSSSYPSRLHNS